MSEPIDSRIREELESHIVMRTDQLVEQGMSPEEAALTARRMLGNTLRAHEETRLMHINVSIETIGQDLRYAVRGIFRQPGFAAAAICTLALGIGVTTAVFSAVDRVLFRSLPYPHAERLVAVGMLAPIEPNEFLLTADYFAWKDRQTAFESLTSWSGASECDLTDGTPKRVACGRVESNFLATLSVDPLHGRSFQAEDDRPNAPPIAILSHNLWRSRYGADPTLVGRTVLLDGKQTRVTGILPPDFQLPVSSADILVPQTLARSERGRPGPFSVVRAFGRLKPGISIQQAQASLAPLFDESLKYVPKGFLKEVHLSVVSLQERQTRDSRSASWLLLAAVGVVSLIACANVANLLLARAASRQRELAVRAALGAGRWRLVRQALTESTMLSLIGGSLGCALAFGLLRIFVALAPSGIRGLAQASIDARALLFTLGVSLSASLLFGLAPALYQPPPEMLSGARMAVASRRWFRHALLVGQIAASLILLTSAGLLLRSLWKLQNVPLGLDASHVLVMPVVLGPQAYPDPAKRGVFFEELERRITAAPGLEAAAVSDTLPPSGGVRTMIYHLIQVEGRPPVAEGTGGMVIWRAVTPRYFAALGIPIVEGRPFQDQDRRRGDEVMILNTTLSRKLFGPGVNPVGQRVRVGGLPTWYSITGVAADVKNSGLELPVDPEYYLPRKLGAPEPQRRATFILRTSLAPKLAERWLRTAVADLDRTLPVEVERLSNRIDSLTQRQRLSTMLLGFFAISGLLLAAVGLYGVGSFLVAERTQEIGVRMALGATGRIIAALVLRRAALWTTMGAVLGLTGSFVVAHTLQPLLFETPAMDPLPVSAALTVLVVVAFASAWSPSRRAAKLDPMVALRHN